MTELPFSQSCENNKSFILDILREAFADRREVLEIASGTGQHACHFAANMPWLRWQPTEMPEHLPLLEPRCSAYAGTNLLPPPGTGCPHLSLAHGRARCSVQCQQPAYHGVFGG